MPDRELDLAGMDADADRQAEPIGGFADRCRTANRAERAGEHRQEAIARRVHLLAQVALEPGPDEAVVLAEPLLPGHVPESAGGRGRLDDVGHQERRDDAVLARWSPELLDVAEEVEEDGRLVADHPGIMAGWSSKISFGPISTYSPSSISTTNRPDSRS
jgi:hypothetical protein